jgi:cation/acetate symporter
MTRSPSALAIAMFIVVMLVTLAITYWAARRIKTRKDFYAAGGKIRGWQNGLAISGDFMSAATILGVTGLMYTTGYDSMIYILGPIVGFSVIIFLLAERFRNLGKYTFTDVASFRLEPISMKAFGACGSLVVVIFYMVAQMVGAGALIQVLFNIQYTYAVILVGVLMILYVSLGGMLATTWVQIVKAVLLIFATAVITVLVLAKFGFSLEALFRAAVETHPKHMAIMGPGAAAPDAISAASLAIAVSLGIIGLPHILMRFFTVPDAKQARLSIFVALVIVFVVFFATYVIGYGAIALIMGRPEFTAADGGLIGGSNMATVHLADMVGGDVFFGFISAVAFATILAVVAGLTLAGASAVSHDLYGQVFRKGQASEKEEVMVSRIAAICVGAAAVFLGIVFEKQNVAFMVSLGLSAAASANFPVLILSMYWKGFTTRGAFIGGFAGLISAIVLVTLGPVVWVQILGHAKPIFPYAYPALHSMILAFFCCWFFSVTDRSKRAAIDKAGFEAQNLRSQTGIGAEGAVEH